MSVPVGVEQVIRSRRILVDTFLHQAHAEDAGIEVDIVLGVACDAGYVV